MNYFKHLYFELFKKESLCERVLALADKTFDTRCVYYDSENKTLEDYCIRNNRTRGAIYPYTDRTMFREHLETILEGVKDNLESFSEVELASLAQLKDWGYADSDEYNDEKNRMKLVPLTISLTQHFGGNPYDHEVALVNLYKKYRDVSGRKWIRYGYA